MKLAVRSWVVHSNYDCRHCIVKITVPPQVALEFQIAYVRAKFTTVTIRICNKDCVDDDVIRSTGLG